MNDRFYINGDNAWPHAVLWQSYTVEEVARIAATCAGETHHERVIEALKLIEAVENIANPFAPWLDQDSRRKEGDGLGAIPDLQKEQVLYELQQKADEIIKLATDTQGNINRIELCNIACEKAGRKSPKTKKQPEERPLTSDRVEKLFLREWLTQAAEDFARWKLFRQMKRDYDQDQETLRSAIEHSLSKHVIAKLKKKLAAADKRSFQGGREYCPAAVEIDRKRKELTDQERKAEREEFRLSLEQGTKNQPRIIHTENHARAILLGTEEFSGFLEFVRFPESKPKYVPTLPKPKNADGTYGKADRDVEGKVNPIGDVQQADELPMPGVQFGDEEGTEKKIWKKKR